jgi:hypothetical protein
LLALKEFGHLVEDTLFFLFASVLLALMVPFVGFLILGPLMPYRMHCISMGDRRTVDLASTPFLISASGLLVGL